MGIICGREHADVVDVRVRVRRHRADRLALLEHAVDHADVGDHAAVLVELRVEDQRARRRRPGSPDGGGTRAISSSSTSGTPSPVLPLIFRIDCGVLADQLAHLAGHALGLGARQVDLVQARDQLQARLDRQVGVGDRLRLHALRGVDDQQRALARRQRARHLVGEVDVPGRVDQVQLVGLAVARRVEHAHRLRLDRDAALALQVHRVQQLRAHLARGDRVRQLEDAIGQRRLAVVDVRDDREVADVRLVHGRATA